VTLVGLEREPSEPSEPGGPPIPFDRVGGFAAAMDRFATWLSPRPRRSRYVRVPDLRGMRMSRAWEPAYAAGVKLRIHRLTEHPAPVDGLVVEQVPPPGTRVKRDSTVTLTVLHPEHAPWNLSSS